MYHCQTGKIKFLSLFKFIFNSTKLFTISDKCLNDGAFKRNQITNFALVVETSITRKIYHAAKICFLMSLPENLRFDA